MIIAFQYCASSSQQSTTQKTAALRSIYLNVTVCGHSHGVLDEITELLVDFVIHA